MKLDWLRGKKGNISFTDLKEGMEFLLDGLHLNKVGNERKCRRLCEWMRARSTMPE